MKYPDFPKIKVPAFLIEWNHNGLYFDQMNPCSYKYGDGYTLVVFVGSETDPREFEISITDNDGNVGAECIASTAEEAEQYIENLIKFEGKRFITTFNILSIARGESK